MTMFTRRCSRQLKTWRTEFASGFKIFLSLILLSSFFVSGVNAQIGTAPVNPPIGGLRVDGFLGRQGPAGDWFAGPGGNAAGTFFFNPNGSSQYPALLNQTLFWKIDAYTLGGTTIGGPEDRFTQGSKLNDDPNTWHWDDNQPQSKDDINNAFFALVQNPIDGHWWALMGGDREATNGTSFLDFEFLQHEIVKNPDGTFTSSGPDDGRTVGDLDVSLDYTGGGGTIGISVLEWSPVGDGSFIYTTLSPPITAFFASPNHTNGTPFPGLSGAFGQNNYPDSLMFVEGALDITATLGTGIGTPCRALPFTSVFIKTKSSASTTAELKDFIAPFAVNICTDNVAPTVTATGTPSNGQLGCNPSSSAINAALGSATSTDACSTPTVTTSDGGVLSNGCLRSQTRTFTARDECGNTASTSRTATWTADVTPPVITTGGTPANGVLGCNPSTAAIDAALGTATASDGCGVPSLSASTGAIQSNGCLRSQTRTWTATDACGNTATASRTATWTFDITAPTITASGNNNPLGCNPSTAAINAALGSASATDACGGATVGTPSDGAVQSNGCIRSQTRTFTATDACGNTASTSRTVSWTFDVTPPTIIISGAENPTLCNPSSAAIEAALGSATATDACGGATITNVSTSGVTGDCVKSQTRTFTATDACGNTATMSRTIQFSSDAVAPTITATGTPPNGVLGCNPSTAAINAALGSASATDNCGTPAVTQSDGPVSSNGCIRSQTRTFTATDVCGNTATTSRTATWTVDVTAPTITATGNNSPLGCNPSTAAIDGALGSASATDACGTPTVSTSTGPIVSTGCLRSQVRTFTATDACGNTSSTSRSATWTFDITPPVFIGDYSTVPLGCNPSTATISTALDGAAASDACGAPGLTLSDGPVQSNGCLRSQTRTFTATDGCGNTATVSRTATWTFDVTAPTITATGNNSPLGCNPSAGAIDGALGSASATDACGVPTVSTSTGSIVTTGCLRSQVRTFTATDACGNVATTSRSATWTVDVTAPDITSTGTPANGQLGCNPSTAAIEAALGSGSATDACGTPTVTASTGAVQSNGCLRSQTRTFTATDACGNTATTSRTATWTFDITPPVITATGTPANGAIEGCNPSSATINAALGSATASDACGAASITVSDGAVQSSGCDFSQTRRWTATDACGNTATASRTATWHCCPATLCTYTQGYYGNEGGISCDGRLDPADNEHTTIELINLAIANAGGTITIGCAGHSVTISAGQASCVIDKLPGGGSSSVLSGDHTICNFDDLKNGRIDNALLAQTITLALNVNINPPSLGNFALEPNKWLVTADNVECGSNTIKSCTFNCAPDPLHPGQFIWTVATTPYHVSDCQIPQAVYDALTTKNVSGLLALANSALCGTALPAGVTLDNIKDAVDCINNAFDGCRSFIQWVSGARPSANSFCTLPSPTTPCPPSTVAGRIVTAESVAANDNLRVTAYPNPFKSTVRFTIQSNISGQAQLEVYNSTGQRISVAYSGYLQANRGQVVEYKAPQLGTNLIYILRVGSKQVSGKLLRLE